MYLSSHIWMECLIYSITSTYICRISRQQRSWNILQKVSIKKYILQFSSSWLIPIVVLRYAAVFSTTAFVNIVLLLETFSTFFLRIPFPTGSFQYLSSCSKDKAAGLHHTVMRKAQCDVCYNLRTFQCGQYFVCDISEKTCMV